MSTNIDILSYNYIVGVSICTGLLVVLSLLIIILLFNYRNRLEIKRSSLGFCYLICIGSLCGYSLILLYPYIRLYPSLCKLFPSIFSLGLNLTFGSSLLKLYRLHKIFNLKVLTVQKISNKYLFQYMGILSLVDLIINLCWNITDPFTLSTIQYLTDSENKNNLIYTCSSKYIPLWIILLLGPKLLILIFNIYFAYKTRSVVKNFNESFYIFISVLSTGIAAIIVAPLTVLVRNVNEIYILYFLIVILVWTVSLFALFTKKFIIIYNKNKHINDIKIFNTTNISTMISDNCNKLKRGNEDKFNKSVYQIKETKIKINSNKYSNPRTNKIVNEEASKANNILLDSVNNKPNNTPTMIVYHQTINNDSHKAVAPNINHPSHGVSHNTNNNINSAMLTGGRCCIFGIEYSSNNSSSNSLHLPQSTIESVNNNENNSSLEKISGSNNKELSGQCYCSQMDSVQSSLIKVKREKIIEPVNLSTSHSNLYNNQISSNRRNNNYSHNQIPSTSRLTLFNNLNHGEDYFCLDKNDQKHNTTSSTISCTTQQVLLNQINERKIETTSGSKENIANNINNINITGTNSACNSDDSVILTTKGCNKA